MKFGSSVLSRSRRFAMSPFFAAASALVAFSVASADQIEWAFESILGPTSVDGAVDMASAEAILDTNSLHAWLFSFRNSENGSVNAGGWRVTPAAGNQTLADDLRDRNPDYTLVGEAYNDENGNVVFENVPETSGATFYLVALFETRKAFEGETHEYYTAFKPDAGSIFRPDPYATSDAVNGTISVSVFKPGWTGAQYQTQWWDGGVVVPEPGTAALGLLGFSLLFFPKRRRRRRDQRKRNK